MSADAFARITPDAKPVWRRAIVSALGRSYGVSLVRDPKSQPRGLYAYGDAALVEAVATLYTMYSSVVDVLSAQRAALGEHPTVVDRWTVQLVRGLFNATSAEAQP